MIKTYRHPGLNELFATGTTARITSNFHVKLRQILDVLNSAKSVRDLNQPGFRLHQLKQFKPVRFSVRVNAAWRVTFEFDNGDAYRVDFEQYHDRDR